MNAGKARAKAVGLMRLLVSVHLLHASNACAVHDNNTSSNSTPDGWVFPPTTGDHPNPNPNAVNTVGTPPPPGLILSLPPALISTPLSPCTSGPCPDSGN
jgi:hypothetical protein